MDLDSIEVTDRPPLPKLLVLHETFFAITTTCERLTPSEVTNTFIACPIARQRSEAQRERRLHVSSLTSGNGPTRNLKATRRVLLLQTRRLMLLDAVRP